MIQRRDQQVLVQERPRVHPQSAQPVHPEGQVMSAQGSAVAL